MIRLQKRVPVERCAELTIVAATHGLKEAWISYQVYFVFNLFACTMAEIYHHGRILSSFTTLK
jgi:hypothetical protein